MVCGLSCPKNGPMKAETSILLRDFCETKGYVVEEEEEQQDVGRKRDSNSKVGVWVCGWVRGKVKLVVRDGDCWRLPLLSSPCGMEWYVEWMDG